MVRQIVLGGLFMELKKSLVGVFTFSAVILGALSATQTVKADAVSDQSSTTPVATVNDVAPTTQTSTNTNQLTETNTDTNSNIIYNALPSAEPSTDPTSGGQTTTTTTGSNTSTAPTNNQNQYEPSYTYNNNVNSATTNTNGGKWTGSVVYSRPQDNFYMYENGQWVQGTEVNDNEPSAGTFDTVTSDIDKEVEQKFIDYSNGMDDSAGNAMNEATWYYQLTSNDDLSNVGVITPDMSNEINSILNLKTIIDVYSQFTNMVGRDQPTPFSILIQRDQNDPTKNAMYFFGGQPILLADGGQGIIADNEDAIVSFLQSAGYSDDEIQNIITGTVNYDQLLLNTLNSRDLSASPDDNANYAQVGFQDLQDLSQYFNFNGIVQTLTGETPDYVYEMTPTYFNNMSKLLNPSTLNDLKGWLVSDLILYRASELQDITDGFQSFLQSTNPELAAQYNEDPNNLSSAVQQQLAYYLTSTAFTDAFSQYYGPQLITDQEKQAVTTMTKKIIYAYSEQIINANWLDDATKKAALGKLSRLKVNIGYPSSTDFDYFNRVDIEGFNSAYINYRNLVGAQALQNFADFSKPVDRGAWQQGNSALVPNASYDRLTNSITIDAGIINSPFFSLDNTDSQNYGGLGVIIGHELTHAFDAVGSQYDGNGEFKDWWSDNDKANFDELVQKMTAEYNGISYGGSTVNGAQTVDENIADNGGLNVALAALETYDSNYDLKQFFENYALGWRSKYTPEMQAAQLEDVHTPDSIRVNTSLQNIGAFYDTFNVKPGDGMYLAPADRVNIW